MRLKVLVALFVVVSAAAQLPLRNPSVIISQDASGPVNAWLSLYTPISPPLAEAFAQAMGCPASALHDRRLGDYSLHLECPSPLRRHSFRSTSHWDFAALNAQLIQAGAESVDISINHPRSGFSRIEPALAEFGPAGFRSTHNGTLPLHSFRAITLETGFENRQLGIAASVALFILLLPLLLFPARAGGRLSVVAAADGLFCLGVTVWLSTILSLNLSALLPRPWSMPVESAPVLIAVWFGSRICGAPPSSSFFWRGLRAVAFLLLMVNFFDGAPSLTASVVCCAVAIAASFWQLRRGSGHRLQTLAEGALATRVRELAARAGTTVRSVQVLSGAGDLPAAFATRFHGILLSAGLLAALSQREVDAIVCHELSHIRRPPFNTARRAGYLLPVAIGCAFFVPQSVLWIPLLLPVGFLLHKGMRRRGERLADADAVTWSGEAEALITGLLKVTRANSLPIEWPRWVRILVPHPSTFERVQAIAAQAHIGSDRLRELLAAPTVAPDSVYTVPLPVQPDGSVFSPAARKRLTAWLSLVSLAVPIAFGVAAPHIGYLAALLAGAATALFAAESIVWRTRSRARTRLAGPSGVFSGFSPAVEPRLYQGSYDYDWGFASFEEDLLVFHGDRGAWSVARSEIAAIRLAPGPFGWFPQPVVSFQLKSGQIFRLRPFDGAFGPAASRAAKRLHQQADLWYRAAPSQSAAHGDYNFGPASLGQIPPPYTATTLARALPIYGAVTLAIHWAILTASPSADWVDPFRILTPVAVSCAILVFLAYPGLRRTSQSKTSRPAPRVAPLPSSPSEP